MAIWGGDIACTVQTDNLKGGELAAEYIAKRLGYRGKVINIQGPHIYQTSLHRSEGLHNVLGRYPDLEVVFERETDWNTAESGRQAMAEALNACPETEALFATADPLLLGALQVVKAAGRVR